jgi:tetratricopeptide (TPR) repeat protein
VSARLALALAATLLVPAGARAQSAETAESAAERGRAAFEAGRFAEARQAFLQALEATPPGQAGAARILYNLARAEQELGEHCAAVDRFRRYLSAAGADAGEQKRVEKANAALAAERAACKAVLEPEPAPAVTPAPELAPAPVSAPTPAEAEADAPGPWRWVAAGGAAIALGAGVTFNVLARDRVSTGDTAYQDFVDSGRTDARAADRTGAAYDDARGFSTASVVALGAGAALTGLATWLFLRD